MYYPNRYRKFRTRKPKGKRSIVRKAIRNANNKVFHKKVMKVIHSQAESKQAAVTTSLIQFNSGIAAVGDILRVVPQVNQGSADNQRIGDQIRAQKLTIDGILNFPPILSSNVNSPGRCRIGVRMMLVTPKGFPNWATASATASWLDYLLKKGGTTSAFTGATMDLYAPVNTDAITCHWQKVFYMNQPFVQHLGSTTDSAIVQTGLVRHVKKTIRFKNSLFKYDSSIDSGLTPVNKGYFLLIGYAYTDGTSSPDVLSTNVTFQYYSTLDFEDS